MKIKMKTTNQKAVLMERIIALQKQQEQDLQVLKEQYYTTINSFSTINLIKKSFQEVVSTPHLTSNIIQGTLEMGTQYLSKTFFNSNSNKVTGWLGKIVQFVLKK